MRPGYIILYDCDMTFVRQVEVYQANNPEIPVRVYFMVYKGSVEEQAYLTTLRREKEAFEGLIRAKADMVIPQDREGREGDNLLLARGSQKASDVIMDNLGRNSRRGGGAEAKETRIIARPAPARPPQYHAHLGASLSERAGPDTRPRRSPTENTEIKEAAAPVPRPNAPCRCSGR